MRTSLKITKNAKNSIFDNCTIYGGVEDSGKNTLFRRTIIGLENKLKDHPIIYGVIVTVVGGVILFYVTKLLK